MNLTISPANYTNNARNSVSFGMAEFTPRGRAHMEATVGDVYEPIKKPNELNPNIDYVDFYKKHLFTKTEFEKLFEDKIVNKKEPTRNDYGIVYDVIVTCGATESQETNAKFINNQLVKAKDSFDRLDEKKRIMVSQAVKEVFDTNYDNPRVSLENTQTLLSMAAPAIDNVAKSRIAGALIDSTTGGYQAPAQKKSRR